MTLEAFPEIPAGEALSAASRNRASVLPFISSGDPRVAAMASPEIRPTFTLEPGESIFTIGSCFARGVELELRRRGFHIPTLAFEAPDDEIEGTWKNPASMINKYSLPSMINEVEMAFAEDGSFPSLVEDINGTWDTQLNTLIPVTRQRAEERRTALDTINREAIRTSRVIIITLGLVEVWKDNLTGVYLNRAPHPRVVKRHDGRFSFETLRTSKVIDLTFALVDLLKRRGREDLRIMLTLSPVPIGRTFNGTDVIVANTYSKSALRCAAEEVVRSVDGVDYFPSYETVLYSDRALAWRDDLRHVTQAMVRHNVNRMLAAYLPGG